MSDAKSGVGIGIVIAVTHGEGIAGSYLYPSKDSPQFLHGQNGLLLVVLCSMLWCSVGPTFLRRNRTLECCGTVMRILTFDTRFENEDSVSRFFHRKCVSMAKSLIVRLADWYTNGDSTQVFNRIITMDMLLDLVHCGPWAMNTVKIVLLSTSTPGESFFLRLERCSI